MRLSTSWGFVFEVKMYEKIIPNVSGPHSAVPELSHVMFSTVAHPSLIKSRRRSRLIRLGCFRTNSHLKQSVQFLKDKSVEYPRCPPPRWWAHDFDLYFIEHPCCHCASRGLSCRRCYDCFCSQSHWRAASQFHQHIKKRAYARCSEFLSLDLEVYLWTDTPILTNFQLKLSTRLGIKNIILKRLQMARKLL